MSLFCNQRAGCYFSPDDGARLKVSESVLKMHSHMNVQIKLLLLSGHFIQNLKTDPFVEVMGLLK